MKNIVLFGGGTGLSTILKGIKNIDNLNLQAIVTVADSGGSTGVIRKEFNIPALGDIRQVMLSLSNNETILEELMSYRFESSDAESVLKNHSLGNLMIYALIDLKNDFYQGISYLSKIFNIKGEVIPVTDYSSLQLKAIYTDGTIQLNEHEIPRSDKKISEISYIDIDKIKVNPRAIQVINDADIIVFSCGSLYTSIIASIILPGIKQALIENNEAKEFVYVSNISTQPEETTGMSAYDHITEIEKYLCPGIIDTIIINNVLPGKKLVDQYINDNRELIVPDEQIRNSHCKVIETSLIDNSNHRYIRHDSKKIAKVFRKILGE
ncbi:MAG: gluconeogenesis factor YvcK family protein [Mycoplasma sp.]